jgi:hypothetical protein
MTLDTLLKAWRTYDDAYKAENAETALLGIAREVTMRSCDLAMMEYSRLSSTIMKQSPDIWSAFVDTVNTARYIPSHLH